MESGAIVKTVPSDAPVEPKAKSKVMPVVVFALFGAAGLMGVVFAAAVKILRSDIAGNNACTPHSGTYQQASQVLTATVAAPASYVSSTTSTSGTSISLNYVKKNGFQGMALGIMIDGVTTEPAQSLLDLGSSTMSFCDTSLPSKLSGSATQKKTSQAQCNMYGNGISASQLGQDSCALAMMEDGISEMVYEWFYGSVYNGTLVVDNDNGNPQWRMQDVVYTVMDDREHMTCSLGFGGIFGVAFSPLNSAIQMPDSTTSPSSLLIQPSQCSLSQSDGTTIRLGVCSSNGYSSVGDQTPIMHTLAAAGERRFGLYTNIGKLAPLSTFSGVSGVSSDGSIVYDKGTLYIGPSALTNEYYNSATAKTVYTWHKLNSGTSAAAYWSFQLTSFTAQGSTTSFSCASQGTCIVDSGNPTITLASEAVTAMGGTCSSGAVSFSTSTWPDLTLNMRSSLTDSSTTVPITVTGALLKKYSDLGWLVCASGTFALGLPITELFYLVFDNDLDTITFVAL